jgi:NitT/TauT family transport system substrate-binding protein
VENGHFERRDLEVELIYFESGTAAATALIADEADICQIAGSSVVNAAVAGEDLLLIAGIFNSHVYSLVVTPEITEPDDLRGQAVAVSRIGSSSDAAMRIALQSFGLTPDEDVTVLEVGGQSARVAALESGEIAGTLVSIPASTQAIRSGFPELLNMASLDSPYQHTAIATTRSFLDTERETAVAFLQALIEAMQQMATDREGTIAVMAEYLQFDPVADRDMLGAAYDDLIPAYLPDEPYPTLDGIQTLLDNLAALNPDAAGFRPVDIVDTTVLDDALAGMDE